MESEKGPVLVILHGESVGGATLSILRVVPLLQSRGWRFVFWAERPSEVYDAVAQRGWEVYGEPRALVGYSWKALQIEPGVIVRLRRLPRYFGSLRRLMRDQKPALVHANSLHTLAEVAVARSAGLPTLFHVHEMVRPNRKGAIARELAGRLNTVVAGVSSASAEALSSKKNPARIVYECVSVPDEVPDRSGRGGQTVVGTIGVIARRKGTDLFAEAARLIQEETDEVSFRVVGRPDDPLDQAWAEEVLSRMASLGIHQADRADVYEELAKLDVFVLPSRSDPFPIVVLEAMATGLPVVGTRVDGIAEELDERSGLLVEPEDPRGLADAILRLHRDLQLRGSLGAGARTRVAESFGLDRQADALEACYLAAISED